MIRKYHNHKPQTTLWHREEEPLNHHGAPERQIKQSDQPPPPIKTNATPERTQSNAQQNIEQLQTPTCLIADACLTADPRFTSLIQAQSHAFVEIYHEIISGHSPPFCLFKKGCCQLQAKVCTGSTC